LTATPEQIPTDLTLEIGDNLSPERFMTAARAFFSYVEELSHAFISPDGKMAHWVVRVREGSALLAVDPAPNVPPEIVRGIYSSTERGIRHLIEGNIEESGLPEPALRHLRTLSELTEGGRRREPVPIRLWVRRKPIDVDPTIASAIREDIRSEYSDYGTLEGRLEAIEESHLTGGLLFYIRDVMLRQKVRCYFPEELLPEVFEKFRKRVEIAGVIRYRTNGSPVRITVDRIEALPDDNELPTAEDVRGILRRH
jgi:hypothetical protein